MSLRGTGWCFLSRSAHFQGAPVLWPEYTVDHFALALVAAEAGLDSVKGPR